MQLSSSAAHLSQNIIPPLFRYQIHKSDTSSAQSSTKLLIISVKTMPWGIIPAFRVYFRALSRLFSTHFGDFFAAYMQCAHAVAPQLLWSMKI